MRKTLLVTNDFPPKIGGIQNYLWELVRRLPADDISVYTTPYRDSAAFDARSAFLTDRSVEPVLLPSPWLTRRIRSRIDEQSVGLTLLDPAVPVGAIGPWLERPYGVVLHGAEVTIPGRIPGSSAVLARVLRGASIVVSAGEYAAAEAERCAGRSLPTVVIPPGVDSERFHPVDGQDKNRIRAHFGLSPHDLVVSSVSRLVPRKGMGILIEAAAWLSANHPNLRVLIGGAGREEARLKALIESTGAPVRLLGRISDSDVVDLYGASDLMAMFCRSRWAGLEQEGFGIVFLEAAACGIPQVAGRSGGASEATVDGETGLVVPADVDSAVVAIGRLISDPVALTRMGRAARERAVREFDYDLLAEKLEEAINSAKLIG